METKQRQFRSLNEAKHALSPNLVLELINEGIKRKAIKEVRLASKDFVLAKPSLALGEIINPKYPKMVNGIRVTRFEKSQTPSLFKVWFEGMDSGPKDFFWVSKRFLVERIKFELSLRGLTPREYSLLKRKFDEGNLSYDPDTYYGIGKPLAPASVSAPLI